MVQHGYFLPGKGAKYCDQRVCMSVCLSIDISKTKFHEIFCTSSYLWLWLGPPLTGFPQTWKTLKTWNCQASL